MEAEIELGKGKLRLSGGGFEQRLFRFLLGIILPDHEDIEKGIACQVARKLQGIDEMSEGTVLIGKHGRPLGTHTREMLAEALFCLEMAGHHERINKETYEPGKLRTITPRTQGSECEIAGSSTPAGDGRATPLRDREGVRRA